MKPAKLIWRLGLETGSVQGAPRPVDGVGIPVSNLHPGGGLEWTLIGLQVAKWLLPAAAGRSSTGSRPYECCSTQKELRLICYTTPYLFVLHGLC